MLLFLTGEVEVNVEDVFCSKVRMKILKLLFKFGQLHTSNIAVRCKVNYATALKHLELLERESLVQHRSWGRVKYFRFSETHRAKAALELLGEWEQK
jgi:predicted ArsR family transcriptional regulator